jgi:hypothetical protein
MAMRTAEVSAQFSLNVGSRDLLIYNEELECRYPYIDWAVQWLICVRFPGEDIFRYCARTGYGAHPIFFLVGIGLSHPTRGGHRYRVVNRTIYLQRICASMCTCA